MPAGVVIGTIELVVPYLAMKFPGWRSVLIAVAVAGTLLASLLLWLLPQSATGAKLFAVYILASYGGAYAVLMSLITANTAGYTKRSVASSGMFVGYCIGRRHRSWIFRVADLSTLGNFIGPLVFLEKEKPLYTTGWIVTVGLPIHKFFQCHTSDTSIDKVVTSAMCIVLAIVYRFVCAWENKKRDRAGVPEGFEHAYEDDSTDKKNPQFRYTL